MCHAFWPISDKDKYFRMLYKEATIVMHPVKTIITWSPLSITTMSALIDKTEKITIDYSPKLASLINI